jgi:hypothetical protein
VTIQTRSHLIRAGAGKVRVLRLAVVGRFVYPLRYTARSGPGCCQYCGCTDRYGCGGGCGWANASHTICTRCLEQELLP